MRTCLDTELVLAETPEAKNPQLPTLDEQLKRDSAKEELNRVFQVLKMETIRDDRRIKQIRHQIDDVLEHNDPQLYVPNPHSLETNESNELLNGLKELYKQSSDSEQTRLMTIAPLSWGRVMLSKWFGCSDHHGRQAILLRQEKKVLAFPEYSRGNKFLDHDTIELIVQFYLQDGISRMSSNTKDVIKIKDELVSVRFMEMTVYEALRKFYDEYPMTKVGKSSFYSLRPRQVKLNCPHETCMCHIHENMSLLLQKMNEEAAKSKDTSEPPINAYYLNSTTIDDITKTLLSNRFKQLNGRIKDIRQLHQFDPKDQFTIFCRKTSNSLIVEEFTLRTNTTDGQNESLRQIKTIKDISIDHIVILKHGDKQHLAK
ncbi:unnamed protein product, partial [Rotaria sordida]